MNVPASPELTSNVPAKATPYEIAAWITMALAIGFTLYHQLLPALLAGLFVFSMVHRIARHLTDYKMTRHKARIVAVLLISLFIIGVSAGLVFAVIGLVRGRIGGVPQMMEKVTQIVESFRVWFTEKGIGEWIPNAEVLHEKIVEFLKTHTDEFKRFGGETTKMAVHALVGIVIGALVSFHSGKSSGPLAAALLERIRRFAQAFEAVVFAQVKISALNTLLTGIYLLLVMPLFGHNIPFKMTLVLVTFVAGLIPVLGNLISNTVITLLSLSISPGVAATSLAFLIVVHKLEYFLNAKIVGGHIHAAAWELLLAMLCFESAFGIPGVIIAPIAYAYLKNELSSRGLI